MALFGTSSDQKAKVKYILFKFYYSDLIPSRIAL